MRQTILALVAIVLVPFAVGCSQNSQIVRGQAPAESQAWASAANGEEAECDDPNCPHCRKRSWCERCRSHCCCHCEPYCIPCDVSFPPAGDLPGIVQYPYYTNKGPDCFFHK
jgi:hypothetical protein